jgi:hypothetical protein
MRRLAAILRYLYHAIEPPRVETWRTGAPPHYRPASWAWHAGVNLREAWRLISGAHLDQQDRRFHRLEENI